MGIRIFSVQCAMIDPVTIRSTRILVVDDCCDTAATLSEFLKWKGSRHVSWTSDSEAAINLVATDCFDLLLLDMHMPSPNGLEIMRHLHEIEVQPGVPVIAFSGDQRYRSVSIAAGANAFLIKPFHHEALEATISDTLSRTTLIPSSAREPLAGC